MSDFLTQLIVGEQEIPGLRPRLASRFEEVAPVDLSPDFVEEERSEEPTLPSPETERPEAPPPPLVEPSEMHRLGLQEVAEPHQDSPRYPPHGLPVTETQREVHHHHSERETSVLRAVQPPTLVPPTQPILMQQTDASEAKEPKRLTSRENSFIPPPQIKETRVEYLREVEPQFVNSFETTPHSEAKIESPNILPLMAEKGTLEPASLRPLFPPVRPEPAPTATPEPTIQVTIGRIEIRATPEQKAPPRPAKPKGVMSLDEYLDRKAG